MKITKTPAIYTVDFTEDELKFVVDVLGMTSMNDRTTMFDPVYNLSDTDKFHEESLTMSLWHQLNDYLT